MTTPGRGVRPPDDMTNDDILAELGELDAARLAAKERGRELNAVLHSRLAAENAALHGLTPEGYAEAKEHARDRGVPLAAVLGAHRRARALQVAKATPAQAGAKANDTGKK